MDREDAALNGLVIAFYMPVALGSLLYLYATGGDFALTVRTFGEHPARDVTLGLLAGSVLVLGTRLLARLPAGARMVEAFAASIGRPSVATCLALAGASAVGEELLFRAVLQPQLGIVATTVLFAAAHFPFDRKVLWWPLLALPAGFVLGGLYEWTGAALASIVAHAVVNGANLIWLARRT